MDSIEYNLWSNGRLNDELREMEIKLNVMKNADGSALFWIGNTTVIAYVQGPHESSVRGWTEDTQEEGILNV